MNSIFTKAFYTRDIKEFLNLLLPESWQGITARILETGAEFSSVMCAWAPRWSKISPTIRRGQTPLEMAIKSSIYRTHDCFHQLWGLPIPGSSFSEDDFYLYKRSQMCGEVAVLSLIEFAFCKHLYDSFPESKEVILKRNAIQMLDGPLQNKTMLQIALRLDDILHKKSRPKWLRNHKESTDFANDYVPMGATNSRYNQNLDGLELTTWMINDFFHQMNTDPIVDEPLRQFNIKRRETIILPAGWNGLNK